MTLEEKQSILNLLLAEVRREQQTLIQAALTAREAATHEESIAEDKYDTRGLEASYLAGAQAKKAKELERTLFEIENFKVKTHQEQSQIELGSIVDFSTSRNTKSRVFLVPWAGGTQLSFKGNKILIVTPASPLGQELLGRERGDEFDIGSGTQKHSIEIIDFY